MSEVAVNSSEEKQVVLLGRTLKSDPDRIKALLKKGRLKAPEMAITFSEAIVESGHFDRESFNRVYNDRFKTCKNHSQYEKIMEILSFA